MVRGAKSSGTSLSRLEISALAHATSRRGKTLQLRQHFRRISISSVGAACFTLQHQHRKQITQQQPHFFTLSSKQVQHLGQVDPAYGISCIMQAVCTIQVMCHMESRVHVASLHHFCISRSLLRRTMKKALFPYSRTQGHIALFLIIARTVLSYRSPA